ncbi:MAG: vitamin K epoxide reductase family protein [Vicinamibacterales bacterium]
MSRRKTSRSEPVAAPPSSAPRTGWMLLLALGGLAAAAAATWVHYRLLNDPTYVSFCDAGSMFSCRDAYTSRYGSIAGVPVALIGVLYFGFVLGMITLCQRSPASRENLPGYVFAVSTAGLAGVLYFAYVSFFVLGTVCLLCAGTYVAIIGLFLVSGGAAKFPLSTLPARASRDLSRLMKSPAAMTAVAAFVAAAVAAIVFFPTEPVAAMAGESGGAAGDAAPAGAAAEEQATLRQQLEQWLSAQPRVEVANAPADGAEVVIVKFNDYGCPPCKQTFLDYTPILERYAQEQPGKVKFITKDFPLDPECNQFAPNGSHLSSCEAAVAVRLARETGKADEMERWIFENQATLTPTAIREATRMIAGVTDFEARYPAMLELVKADILQGNQLGVRGTPTFFMNGLQLPGLQGQYFDAAIQWELRRVESAPSTGGTP